MIAHRLIISPQFFYLPLGLFLNYVFPENIHYEICAGRSIVRRLCKYCKVKVAVKMNILNRRYDQKWHFRFLPTFSNILSLHILWIVFLRDRHIWIVQQLNCVLYWLIRLIPNMLFLEVFQCPHHIVVAFYLIRSL